MVAEFGQLLQFTISIRVWSARALERLLFRITFFLDSKTILVKNSAIVFKKDPITLGPSSQFHNNLLQVHNNLGRNPFIKLISIKGRSAVYTNIKGVSFLFNQCSCDEHVKRIKRFTCFPWIVKIACQRLDHRRWLTHVELMPVVAHFTLKAIVVNKNYSLCWLERYNLCILVLRLVQMQFKTAPVRWQ